MNPPVWLTRNGLASSSVNEGAAPTTVSRHSGCSLSADEVFSLMCRETANIHLGDQPRIKAVQRDLAARKSGRLRKAAKAMTKVTLADWKDWAKHHAG